MIYQQGAKCRFKSLNRNKERAVDCIILLKFSSIPRKEESWMERLYSFDIGEICIIPPTIVQKITSSAKVGIHTCSILAVYHFLTKRFLVKALSKVKQAHTCVPHPPTHPPPCHRIPSALLRSPSTLPFFLLVPPSHSVTWRQQEELRLCCQWREGKVRPSPLLCLPLSFL